MKADRFGKAIFDVEPFLRFAFRELCPKGIQSAKNNFAWVSHGDHGTTSCAKSRFAMCKLLTGLQIAN
jgi:hypothetical protein